MNEYKCSLQYIYIEPPPPLYIKIMIQFQIPRNSPNLYRSLDCITTTAPQEPVISNSLSSYLGDIKCRIDHIERDWDVFKRYTNPCEYIHSIVPNKRKSISRYKPLSRSYFKMIELVQFFHLLGNNNTKNAIPVSRRTFGTNYSKSNSAESLVSEQIETNIRTFHLAEGPGGFIEALVHLRQGARLQDEYIGMSLLDDTTETNNEQKANIPAWKKSQNFLRENTNVFIETGADKTGNILSLENFEYCSNKYACSMHLITGDGGFDFSTDFNNQEIYITRLLFGQVAFALCMQKSGGSFILKIFDCFMQHTIDILALLSSMYEKVYITKPQTSRYANSEKYIVCKGFYGNKHQFYPFLRESFAKMMACDDTLHIHRFIKLPISLLFLSRIEEYNAIFGRQQIENIYYTLSLIDNKFKHDKIDSLIKTNIIRSINWCIKHNVVYHSIFPEQVSRNSTPSTSTPSSVTSSPSSLDGTIPTLTLS